MCNVDHFRSEGKKSGWSDGAPREKAQMKVPSERLFFNNLD